MVADIHEAILWMKSRSEELMIDHEKIVLMGGSAGGQLALLAAYTTSHPAFCPPSADKGLSLTIEQTKA
jgi:acetyl esterase/lipase